MCLPFAVSPLLLNQTLHYSPPRAADGPRTALLPKSLSRAAWFEGEMKGSAFQRVSKLSSIEGPPSLGCQCCWEAGSGGWLWPEVWTRCPHLHPIPPAHPGLAPPSALSGRVLLIANLSLWFCLFCFPLPFQGQHLSWKSFPKRTSGFPDHPPCA